MKKNICIFIFVCLIFLLLTIGWTYPLIFRLRSSIFADGKWLFDTLVAIYGIWLNKMAWLGKAALNFNNLIGYPFGVDISCINREPLLEIPLLFLSLWKDEIFAFNIIILSSYFLSAITMYCLALYFTKNKMASFLSSTVYAFCPYHSLQAFSHMSLAVIQWMPLYILCLFKFGEKISYTRSVLCAGAFLLVALSNYYYAYLMFIFTVIFFLFNLYKGFNLIKKFLLMGIIIALVLIPLNYKAIIAVWKGPEFSREAEIPRHAPPLVDLFNYSARVTDYIRPSEYHPVFGRIDFLFMKPYSSASRHWAERTVFLGYIPLILSFYFIGNWFRRKKKVIEELNIYILLLSTITVFIISLPPKLGFLYMPSFFLYKIFPMFRTYARFGILVILGVSIFAGLGFKEVLEHYRRKILFVFMNIGLILFEFTVIPPTRNVDFSKIPSVYEWIKDIPEGVAIAEYPLLQETDSNHYRYLFYQRIHRHPLFNGSNTDSLGDAIRREIMDISDNRSARILRSLGIKYIILHKYSYNVKDLGEIDRNEGLEKIMDFEDSVVYKIIASTEKVEMFFWKNFGSWEKWDDGNNWRWADNNSVIWLINASEYPVKALIMFKAVSFAKDREMQIYLNNNSLYNIKIPSPGSLADVKEVSLRLLLQPGSNILKFYSPQGGEVIDNVLHNGDKRRVCFGFSNVEIKKPQRLKDAEDTEIF